MDSYEVGLRGKAGLGIGWEMSLYHMTKRDDILSYKDPVTNATQSLNAGETLHRGIEIGAGAELTREIKLDVAYSYAKHTYSSGNQVFAPAMPRPLYAGLQYNWQ